LQRTGSCFVESATCQKISINPHLTKSITVGSNERFHQISEGQGVFPGGGTALFSTLDDFARFAQMLCNKGALAGMRIIGRKTWELMVSNHLSGLANPFHNHGVGHGFGLGVVSGWIMDWRALSAPQVHLVGQAWRRPFAVSILLKDLWHSVSPNISLMMSTDCFIDLRTSFIGRFPDARFLEGYARYLA
jgi:hypothetical protein